MSNNELYGIDIANGSRFRIGEMYVDGPHPVTVGNKVTVTDLTGPHPVIRQILYKDRTTNDPLAVLG